MKKWICALAAIALVLCALAYAQEAGEQDAAVTGTVISVSYEEIVLANVRALETEDEATEEQEEENALSLKGARGYGEMPGYDGGYGYFGFPGYDSYGGVNPWQFFEDWLYGDFGGYDNFGGSNQAATLKVTEDTEAFRMEDGEAVAITLNQIQAGDRVKVTYREDTALTVIVEEAAEDFSQREARGANYAESDLDNRM